MLEKPLLRNGIKLAIILSSIFLYYYACKSLMSTQRLNSIKETIFEAIDADRDGLISSREIRAFAPCNTTDDRLSSKLTRSAKRLTYGQFKTEATDVLIKKTLRQCIKNVPIYTNRTQIALMSLNASVKGFFYTFDLNSDQVVTWREYHTVNSFYRKKVKGERKTFQYLDKNLDWRVTPNEFMSSKFNRFLEANTGSAPEIREAPRPASPSNPNGSKLDSGTLWY